MLFTHKESIPFNMFVIVTVLMNVSNTCRSTLTELLVNVTNTPQYTLTELLINVTNDVYQLILTEMFINVMNTFTVILTARMPRFSRCGLEVRKNSQLHHSIMDFHPFVNKIFSSI